MNTTQTDWMFYHAVGNFLLHWAAVVAISILLLTVGLFLVTTNRPVHKPKKVYSLVLIAITTAMAIYFFARMMPFARFVNEQLPHDYLVRVNPFPHNPLMPYAAVFVLVVLGAVDMVAVALRPSR